MVNLKQWGVNPEIVKAIVAKVKAAKAAKKEYESSELAADIVKTIQAVSSNLALYEKQMIIVTDIIEQMKSEKIDVSKYMKYAEYSKYAASYAKK